MSGSHPFVSSVDQPRARRAPTPGGVGVQEAVLAAGLVGVGLSTSDATAAAIIYRVVTFALPPLGGAVSLGWLKKNDYV